MSETRYALLRNPRLLRTDRLCITIYSLRKYEILTSVNCSICNVLIGTAGTGTAWAYGHSWLCELHYVQNEESDRVKEVRAADLELKRYITKRNKHSIQTTLYQDLR